MARDSALRRGYQSGLVAAALLRRAVLPGMKSCRSPCGPSGCLPGSRLPRGGGSGMAAGSGARQAARLGIRDGVRHDRRTGRLPPRLARQGLRLTSRTTCSGISSLAALAWSGSGPDQGRDGVYICSYRGFSAGAARPPHAALAARLRVGRIGCQRHSGDGTWQARTARAMAYPDSTSPSTRTVHPPPSTRPWRWAWRPADYPAPRPLCAWPPLRPLPRGCSPGAAPPGRVVTETKTRRSVSCSAAVQCRDDRHQRPRPPR